VDNQPGERLPPEQHRRSDGSTLESIRRHYRAASSPLADVLARYPDFFAAFEDFRGYVDFWLLQDMVTDDYSAVRFFTPFDDFKPPAIPQDRHLQGLPSAQHRVRRST
jgi:hypothetical protein